jgi:hypothetical protein
MLNLVEFGEMHWTLAFTIGLSQRPREVRILAGNMQTHSGIPRACPLLSSLPTVEWN